MKIIIQILSLLLVSFTMDAQGADPHGNEGSEITGMVFSEIKNDKMFDINSFAKIYAQVWCSQKPELVALFYS